MDYRRSNYCIIIPLEETNGKCMLIHSYTGAMDIVSGDMIKFINTNLSVSEHNFPFSKDTFNLLVTRGYYTQRTVAEEIDYVKRFATLLHKDALNKSSSITLMVSYDCNFRCPYCYEAGISDYGNKWSKKVFTKELVDRVYEAINEIEPDVKKRYKTITLYGGEPLLKENHDIVSYIVEKGQALGYNFDAISNGYDLDYYEDVLSTGAFQRIQITLDGDKEMHNSRRYHYQTGDSFDIIFKNIGLAIKHKVTVGVRFNTDANNIKEIEKLNKLFKDAGYYDSGFFFFNTALLDDYKGGVKEAGSILNSSSEGGNISEKQQDSSISYMTRVHFNKLLREFGLEATHQDYGLYKRLFNSMNYGSYLNFKAIFCGIQAKSIILDPFGDIYGCWETVGIKSHIIGHYKDDITWKDEVRHWRERNIGNTPKCSVCKYALLCGGGCMAKAIRHGNNYHSSYCDGYADIVKTNANLIYKGWEKRQYSNDNK